jgi:hypothetical protein
MKLVRSEAGNESIKERKEERKKWDLNTFSLLTTDILGSLKEVRISSIR